jgi:hypothetical protein
MNIGGLSFFGSVLVGDFGEFLVRVSTVLFYGFICDQLRRFLFSKIGQCL